MENICIDCDRPFIDDITTNIVSPDQISSSRTAESWPMSSIGWLVTALVELILFVMILHKARKDKRRGLVAVSTANSDITTVIANDSRIYFAMCV